MLEQALAVRALIQIRDTNAAINESKAD